MNDVARDLIRLSRAIRSRNIDIIHASDDNRVIACTRHEVTTHEPVVASMNNRSFADGYVIHSSVVRFPPGGWQEVFHSGPRPAHGGSASRTSSEARRGNSMTDHQKPTRSSRSSADDAPQHEWLVVLDEGASATALNGLRAVAHVLHVAGPRLAVVTTADPESLRAVQGVRAVLASVPEHTVYSFSAEELLMVRAFMRRRAAQGPRPGDGLAWDAPGRQPPDCPPWV